MIPPEAGGVRDAILPHRYRRDPSARVERSGGVVDQVSEAQGGAAQVFHAAVDRFGGSVAGAGSGEERQDVRGAALQGPAELADLDEGGGDTAGEAVDQRAQQVMSLSAVGAAVSGIMRW